MAELAKENTRLRYGKMDRGEVINTSTQSKV